MAARPRRRDHAPAGGPRGLSAKVARDRTGAQARGSTLPSRIGKARQGVGRLAWSVSATSLQPIAPKFIGDIGSCRLGDGNVVVAAGVALPQLCHATSIA